MKRLGMYPAVGALALSMGIGVLVVPTVRARSQNQGPDQQQNQSEQKNGTFLGQIIKTANGQYALLTDKEQNKGFFLDNQDKARQFEGKYVKVIGVLETSTGTIHVTDIQPA